MVSKALLTSCQMTSAPELHLSSISLVMRSRTDTVVSAHLCFGKNTDWLRCNFCARCRLRRLVKWFRNFANMQEETYWTVFWRRVLQIWTYLQFFSKCGKFIHRVSTSAHYLLFYSSSIHVHLPTVKLHQKSRSDFIMEVMSARYFSLQWLGVV